MALCGTRAPGVELVSVQVLEKQMSKLHRIEEGIKIVKVNIIGMIKAIEGKTSSLN